MDIITIFYIILKRAFLPDTAINNRPIALRGDVFCVEVIFPVFSKLISLKAFDIWMSAEFPSDLILFDNPFAKYGPNLIVFQKDFKVVCANFSEVKTIEHLLIRGVAHLRFLCAPHMFLPKLNIAALSNRPAGIKLKLLIGSAKPYGSLAKPLAGA